MAEGGAAIHTPGSLCVQQFFLVLLRQPPQHFVVVLHPVLHWPVWQWLPAVQATHISTASSHMQLCSVKANAPSPYLHAQLGSLH